MAKVMFPYIFSLMLSVSATDQRKRGLVMGCGMTDDEEIKVYEKVRL